MAGTALYKMRMRETEERVADYAVNVVVFDLLGEIISVCCDEGELTVGDNIQRHMVKSEWQYLRKNCIAYDCTRAFVDTSLGGMVVFCQIAASMRVMVGLICRGEREAVACFCRNRVCALDKLSPRLYTVLQKMQPERRVSLSELTVSAIRCFTDGFLAGEMGGQAARAAHIIGSGVGIWAELMGCRVECVPSEEAVVEVHDFHSNAFVTVIWYLLFFLRRSRSRKGFIEVGAMDGRPLIGFRCDLPEGEYSIFANGVHRFDELSRCDAIAEKWSFFFTCESYERQSGAELHVSFCPKAFPYDRLRVKEPRRKLKIHADDPPGEFIPR